jgi:predicted TIM-barrel fold metal-dependent hydrolase
MTVIDFRLRPPSRGYLDLLIYTPAKITTFAKQLGVPPPQAALDRSMDALWLEMDEAGIDIGVMNGRQCPPPSGTVSNDDVAEIQRTTKRLVGFGAVPIGTSDWASEAERCIRELGLHGIAIDPGFNSPPVYANDPRVAEIARKCMELRVPLMVTMSAMAGPDLSFAAPATLDQLAASFPDLQIIAAHACWPYVQEMCGVAFRRRNVYVSPDMYMLNCPGVSDFIVAANSFLQDQFLFGTAYPSAPLGPLISAYNSFPLDDNVREKIMYKNAARLLGL